MVDDHIPLQAVAIEWSEEQKCWYIRAMYPNVQFTLEEETTMSINEGQAKLKPSTYFSIGSHSFSFSTAIDSWCVSFKHERSVCQFKYWKIDTEKWCVEKEVSSDGKRVKLVGQRKRTRRRKKAQKLQLLKRFRLKKSTASPPMPNQELDVLLAPVV